MNNEVNNQENAVNTQETVAQASVAEKRCPQCSALLADGAAFCPECGASLKKTCVACGADLSEGQLFCAACGHKTEETVVNADNAAIDQFNTAVAAQNQKKKKLPLIIGICAAVVVVALLFGNVGGFDFESEFSHIAHESWCEIGSDGSYMKIDTNPYDLDDHIEFAAWNMIDEINEKLGFTSALKSKMGETRSIDGRQYDENDKFEVSWTYHPDRGLEVSYEKK